MRSRALAAAAVAIGIGLSASPAQAATIEVTNRLDDVVDDGRCALREAVQAANTNQKVDVCAKGSAQRDLVLLRDKEYVLGGPALNENLNASGDIDVTGGGPLTIRGEGMKKTIISTSALERIIDLPNVASNLRLEALALSAGNVEPYGGAEGLGGNLRSLGGKLALHRVLSESGYADSGGGIFTQGRLTVDRSILRDDDAISEGGSIATTGSAKIRRSRFEDNETLATATADASGGAIHVDAADGVVEIVDTSVRNGEALASGSGEAFGGGVYVAAGTLELRRSEVSANDANAIQNGATEAGGGLYVASAAAAADVVNSTLFGNRAVGADGFGGSIANVGTLTVRHATLDEGSASVGGDHIYNAGSASVGASIVTGGAGTDPCSGGTLTSLGYNVAELDDPSCGYGDDDDPLAFLATGSLGDNGGRTHTVAVAAASDAVDFVPRGLCREITGNRDQRGFVRPNRKNGVKQRCDAGAFELGARKP